MGEDQGVNATANAGNIKNWEVLAVEDSTLTSTGLVAEEVTLTNSTTTLTDATVPTISSCGGSTTLGGASAADDVDGCTSDDTLIVTGTSTVTNAVEGAGGADTLTVSGGASVGTVAGGLAGSDNSAAADGADTITINTTGTVGAVQSNLGDDTITLTSGTVTGATEGNEGNDTITLNGATVAAVKGGDGDDTATWSSGTLSSFDGGNGSDTLEITASEYNGTQVLDGGDDYSEADTWIDSLKVAGFTGETKGAHFLNWEKLEMSGGTVKFSDNALQVGAEQGTGLMLSDGATLDAGSAFTLTGNLDMAAGTTMLGHGAGAGTYNITGNVKNEGLITTQDGVVGDTVTVGGNYSGAGKLEFDVDTATNSADILHVNGDVTGGVTEITVNNLSPNNATGNDVQLVKVDGNFNPSDFTLNGGSVRAGAFDYGLTNISGGMGLSSKINSTGLVYQAAPAALSGLLTMPTLEQRVGQRMKAGELSEDINPVWVRFYGDLYDAKLTSGSALDSSTWGVQAGIDLIAEAGEKGQWITGLTLQYSQTSAEISGAAGQGNINAAGWGIGGTATWYGYDGTYFDVQGTISNAKVDYASTAGGALANDRQALAYALSAEIGHRYVDKNGDNWIPQAQLTLGEVDAGTFTDAKGNIVALDKHSSAVGRLGIAYERERGTVGTGDYRKSYAIFNVLHDFSKGHSVQVGGASLHDGFKDRTWAELGVGGTYETSDNSSVYGEVSYRRSLKTRKSDGLKLEIGFRSEW